MKKFFLMALSVFLFSTTASFAGNDDNSNKVANENNEIEVLVESSDYPFWEGYASFTVNYIKSSVYLKVYNSSPNSCNSYVADIYKDSSCNKKLGGATVRENPNYDPKASDPHYSRDYKYYITYSGDTYYFNM